MKKNREIKIALLIIITLITVSQTVLATAATDASAAASSAAAGVGSGAAGGAAAGAASAAADAASAPAPTVNNPKIDDLLYKFETPDVKNPTTTDYIASLPDGDGNIGQVLGQITYYALIVANALAFLSFLMSGIFLIVSQGNEEELSKAKSMLSYTILAMAICATALAFITGVTHLEFFNP